MNANTHLSTRYMACIHCIKGVLISVQYITQYALYAVHCILRMHAIYFCTLLHCVYLVYYMYLCELHESGTLLHRSDQFCVGTVRTSGTIIKTVARSVCHIASQNHELFTDIPKMKERHQFRCHQRIE